MVSCRSFVGHHLLSPKNEEDHPSDFRVVERTILLAPSSFRCFKYRKTTATRVSRSLGTGVFVDDSHSWNAAYFLACPKVVQPDRDYKMRRR